MFTDLNLTDMETCYKAFRREVIEQITIEENRFGIEPEITAKVARGGWRIYEVGDRLRRAHLRRGQEDRVARRHAGRRVHRALLGARRAPPLVAAGAPDQARLGVPPRRVTRSRRPHRVTSSIDSTTIRLDIFDWP